MPIKTTCPHCGKQFKAKDELAGKKVNCPGCKKVVGVPVPSSHVHPALKVSGKGTAELEALAAEVVSDRPAAPEPANVTIDFTCTYCDAELKLPAELSGKQAPCPECRRIIKVPVLEKTGPRDWRAPEKQIGPSGALRKDLPPDDSWSSAQVGKVSTQALVEAGVLKIPKEKLSTRQWVVRVSFVLFLLAVLAGSGWGLYRWWRGSFEEISLTAIEAYVAGKEEEKPTPEARAELVRLLAEYSWLYEERHKRPLETVDAGKKVARQFKAEFTRARQTAEELRDPVLRYTAALDLLLTAQRLPLDQREWVSTLRVAGSGPPRELILRHYIRGRLKPFVSDDAALQREVETIAALFMQAFPALPTGLGTMDASDQQAALGVLGQEAVAVGKRALALQLLKAHLSRVDPKLTPPLPLLGLAHQLGETLPKDLPESARDAARVVGHAQAGQVDAASSLLEEKFKVPTRQTLVLRLEVAAAALAKEMPPVAQKHLDACREWMGPDRLPDAGWERYRWCELQLETAGPEGVGMMDQKLLSGPALGRFRAMLFARRIEQDLANVTPDQARLLEPSGIGRQLAFLRLARAQARNKSPEVGSWVNAVESRPERVFALMGLLMGQLEAN